MPRIRTIKPESSQSGKQGNLSDRAYRLWVNLILQADDAGRRRWVAEEFRALIYAYQPKVKCDKIHDAMDEIIQVGLVVLYDLAGRTYYELHDWADHQRIDHPTPSVIPSKCETGCLIREHSRGFANVRPDLEGKEGKDLEGWKEGRREGDGAGGNGAGRPAAALPENLTGWLMTTTNLRHLADAKHAGLWLALERAYDQYPWLFFEEEIRKADTWLAANPSKRPTERGMPRFIRNWFDRAVEIGRRKHA